MSHIRLTRPRAVIAAALAALSISAAQASTINYTTLGTFAVASLNTGGVLVTGSNTVNVLNLNGLGVVGGAFDHTVDGAEYLEFSFAGLGSAIDLSYSVSSAGNLNSDGFVGMRTLSVFGVGGGLLGSFSQNYVGPFDVSALVGNAPIDHIRLQRRPLSTERGERPRRAPGHRPQQPRCKLLQTLEVPQQLVDPDRHLVPERDRDGVLPVRAAIGRSAVSSATSATSASRPSAARR